MRAGARHLSDWNRTRVSLQIADDLAMLQDSLHPEMVFLVNLGVSLHVYSCGNLQVASAQTLDCLDIGQKPSFPDWKPGYTGKSFPDWKLSSTAKNHFRIETR